MLYTAQSPQEENKKKRVYKNRKKKNKKLARPEIINLDVMTSSPSSSCTVGATVLSITLHNEKAERVYVYVHVCIYMVLYYRCMRTTLITTNTNCITGVTQ